MPTDVEKRRKQCRVSQRRYRDKKGSMEYNLRLDVNSLKERVERLRQTREVLHTKIWNDRLARSGAVRKAVEQYHTMFAYGLYNPEVDAHAQQCYDVQLGFLNSFLDVDVRFGDYVGIPIVLEQWRRYSRFHSTILVQQQSVELLGTQATPLARVLSSVTVRINRTTLEQVFPSVLQNEELVQLLMGKQVQYTICTTFAFNEQMRVVRQVSEVDFLAGLSHVILDVKLTTEVLSRALITDSSLIGVMEEPSAAAAAGSAEEEKRPISSHHHYQNHESQRNQPLTSEVDEISNSSRLNLRYIMS